MLTQAEIDAEIANLEALLNAGATSITSDGETVTLDQNSIRRRLAELQAMKIGKSHQQRKVRTIDLSNAF